MIPDWSERSPESAAYPGRHWMSSEPTGVCNSCGIDVRTEDEIDRELCNDCLSETLNRLEGDK